MMICVAISRLVLKSQFQIPIPAFNRFFNVIFCDFIISHFIIIQINKQNKPNRIDVYLARCNKNIDI